MAALWGAHCVTATLADQSLAPLRHLRRILQPASAGTRFFFLLPLLSAKISKAQGCKGARAQGCEGARHMAFGTCQLQKGGWSREGWRWRLCHDFGLVCMINGSAACNVRLKHATSSCNTFRPVATRNVRLQHATSGCNTFRPVATHNVRLRHATSGCKTFRPVATCNVRLQHATPGCAMQRPVATCNARLRHATSGCDRLGPMASSAAQQRAQASNPRCATPSTVPSTNTPHAVETTTGITTRRGALRGSPP